MNTKTILLILLVLVIIFIVSKNIMHSKSIALQDSAIKNGGAVVVKNTALHEACFLGHVDTVKLLIQNGADVNAKNNKGETPLHCAADGGMPEIAQILLDAGADINAKSNNGKTAVDYVNEKINLLKQMTNAHPAEGPGKSIVNLALNQAPSLLQRYEACAKVLNDAGMK